ncbi:MAG: MarR family transcriptional regulator, partial [Neptuniibacter sp.]
MGSTELNEIDGRTDFLECLRLIERLHRRILDLLKIRLEVLGYNDINSVQALLLHNIGDREMTAGELRTRGYYL